VSQKNPEVVDDERGTSRLEAFSDGVIAVAITLLVLDIHVPTQEELVGLGLQDWLFSQKEWPHLLGYVTSFLLIGIYWANHHQMFKYIKRTDHFFLMINIVFLMSIVFIPFTTSLMTGFMTEAHKHEAALIYSASLLLAGLTYNAIWWYAAHKHRLLATNLSPSFVRRLRWSYLTGVPLYLLSMLLSLVSVEASIGLYILIAVIYVLPLDRLRFWKESNDATKGDIQNISEPQEERA